jgi:anti-sigma factor RsiW
MRCAECRDRLDAHADGELTPKEVTTVNSHLVGCPECAAELVRITDTSRQLKEGLVRYRAPDTLKARILSAIARSDVVPAVTGAMPWLRVRRLSAAGLVIALASSAFTTVMLQRGTSNSGVAGEVIASHIRSLMPGHLTDVASSEQHNVKPWFNGRVNLSPAVPRLDSAGFPLLGGRLDYVASRPVAVVVYARRQHVINVYSWPTMGDDGIGAVSSVQGYNVISWKKDGVESWVVSDLSAGELSTFVRLLRGGAS